MIIRLFLSFLFIFLFSTCESEVKVNDTCGDGFVDPGEECDGSNLAAQTCETLGHYRAGGTLACLADCTFDRADCGGRCGDDFLETGPGEECDGHDFGDQSCLTLGFYGGYLQCTGTCELDTSVCADTGSCGDSIIQDNFGEECDTDMLDDASCESLGFNSGTLACSDACQYDTSACVTDCGDNQIDPNEECDGSNLADQTCASLGHYNESGTLACLPDCSFDRSDCGGRCGDLTIQDEETCDGQELGGATCGNLGFAGGTLVCRSDCQFDLSGCNRWIAVDAGDSHTCAITEDHSLYCWGDNTYGQLGNGSTTDSPVPVAVTGMATDVMAVATGGRHTCAIKLGGAVWCWGNNTYGQLGIGSNVEQHTPSAILGETFTSVRLGLLFSCGIRTAGTVACWGANTSGQVGFSGNNQRDPYTVGSITGAIAVACGGAHACALNSSGAGFCWGSDIIGQLADGTTSNSYPHQVSIVSAANLGFGENHTCYLSTSGGMYCAGENSSGQLGNGTTSPQTTTVAVTGLISNVLYIDGGFKSTCAVKTDGSVHCWGLNDHGQLGCGNLLSRNQANPVTGLSSGFVEVHAGKYHACALSGSGFLTCWGGNEDGRLGDGGTTDQLTPVHVVF